MEGGGLGEVEGELWGGLEEGEGRGRRGGRKGGRVEVVWLAGTEADGVSVV